MPAPSAAYIASLLGSHRGFRPDSSGAIQLGQQSIQREQLGENKRQFDLENARKDEYLGMQQHQMEMNRVDATQEKLVKAFQEFNEAVTDGDEERARAAANVIRALGGEVEEYTGEALPPAEAAAPAPTAPSAVEAPPAVAGTGGAAKAAAAAAPSPSAMSIGAKESPTAKVAKANPKPVPPKPTKAPSPAPPPNPEPPAWLQGAAKEGGFMPPSGLDTGPFQGLPPATLDRPSPAGPTSLLDSLSPDQQQALLLELQRRMA